MKRALAERAKQTDQRNRATSSKGNSISTPPVIQSTVALPNQARSSSSSSPPPPLKLQKTGEGNHGRNSNRHNSNSTRAPPQSHGVHPQPSNPSATTLETLPARPKPTNPKKRSRPSAPTADQESNAFYLVHQNRALASELHALHHWITTLEKERMVRRRECRAMAKALGNLEGNWVEMEVVLKKGLEEVQSSLQMVPNTNGWNGTTTLNGPASTGTDAKVETISLLTATLCNLAASTTTNQKEETPLQSQPANGLGLLSQVVVAAEMAPSKDGEEKLKSESTLLGFETADSDAEQTYLTTLAHVTNGFSNRCGVFQSSLLELVRQLAHRLPNPSQNEDLFAVASLQKQIATLKLTCQELELKIQELARAREEANVSERKVRRGLYRVAGGRMKIEEVLQALEKDGSSLLDLTELKEKDADPETENNSKQELEQKGENSKIILDGKVIESTHVLQMHKELEDLQIIADSREQRIKELMMEKETDGKKINSLQMKKTDSKLDENDIKTSNLFIELSSKLETAEKDTTQLKEDLQSVKERWAVTKGDLGVANKTINELQEKHQKRLKELNIGNGINSNSSSGSYKEGVGKHVNEAKERIALEHKLKHALENVRQKENVRISLNEANRLNEALQAKVEELKAKNVHLLSNKNSSRGTNDGSPLSTSHLTPHKSSKESSKDVSMSQSSKDKFHKLRKELSAAVNSKNQAKEKQERAEIERDTLLKTNSRLNKQSVEKDDMNAKSLSTILHLKQVSEQLEQEKDILEKKLKVTQQLALAARIAANAKERVEEEALREKEIAEKRVEEIKTSLENLIQDKVAAERELAVKSAENDRVANSLKSIQGRCDDLVSEATANEQEKKDITEALAVAKNDSQEAKKKLSAFKSKNLKEGKFRSEFTTEELTTQVNHLKNRLSCDVCNIRDKNTILLRCRHMFCRQCVDINIKNRSRKCPACGTRFDMKDVSDIWL